MSDHLNEALDMAHRNGLDRSGNSNAWASTVVKTARKLERADDRTSASKPDRQIRKISFFPRVLEAAGILESRRRPPQKLRH